MYIHLAIFLVDNMANVFTPDVLKEFTKQVPELKEYLIKAKMVLEPTNKPPFEALVQSVVYQQLAGKAAQTIYQRLIELVGTPITPKSILQKSQEQLRSVGLSRQKASYVHNIGRAFDENGPLEHYFDPKSLQSLSSKEIIEKFSEIKGVGAWTVEMFLIFSLGRLDVLSSKDLGVRKGVQRMYKLEEVPTPSKVKELGEKWHPLETVGTFLAWRVQEE